MLRFDPIADAAVFGVPIHEGATATCAPRALVVLKPGVEIDQPLLDGIEAHINSKVPDYKRLRGGIHFISTVPREVSGKMKREKLPHLAYL